jgi:hypothetical protein
MWWRTSSVYPYLPKLPTVAPMRRPMDSPTSMATRTVAKKPKKAHAPGRMATIQYA